MRLLLICLLSTALSAQSEIEWTVNLNTQQITQTDAQIFETLESDLVSFLNGRTWTEDRFEPEERIQATIFLTLVEKKEEGSNSTEVVPNRFEGTLAIQTLRPVYGTGEVTPVLNYIDERIEFEYEQFSAIELSEQSFTGELAAIMGFYAYLILALDYDTFSPLGGEDYLVAAQNLYNRLPNNVTNQRGWTTNGKANNRHFLLENLLSPRLLPVRRALYNYHRLGLDMMLIDPIDARNNITLAIEDLQSANQTYPNSALIQAFVDAKRDEIIEIYKGATGVEQNSIVQMMSRIDPSNSNEYRAIRGGASRRSPSGRR